MWPEAERQEEVFLLFHFRSYRATTCFGTDSGECQKKLARWIDACYRFTSKDEKTGSAATCTYQKTFEQSGGLDLGREMDVYAKAASAFEVASKKAALIEAKLVDQNKKLVKTQDREAQGKIIAAIDKLHKDITKAHKEQTKARETMAKARDNL